MDILKNFDLHDKDMLFWQNPVSSQEFALLIQHDSDPEDPRIYENPDVMFCRHPRYRLGDKCEEETVGQFWANLVEQYMQYDEIAEKLVSGDPLEDYDSTILDICRTRRRNGQKLTAENIQELVDSAVYYIRKENIDAAKLSEDHIAALPLWIYDHSGITISCGERTYPYTDRFDSGFLGWIIMDRKTALANLSTDEANWRAAAIKHMKASVKTYDQYLQSEVYGYTLYRRKDEQIILEGELPNPTVSDEDEWEEIDSCWGFYGSDIVASGLLHNVDDKSLNDALESGNYKTGSMKTKVITTLQFHKNTK